MVIAALICAYIRFNVR